MSRNESQASTARGSRPLAARAEELTEAVNEGAYAGRWPPPKRVKELADRFAEAFAAYLHQRARME